MKKTIHATEENTKKPIIRSKDSGENRERFPGITHYKAEQQVDLKDGSHPIHQTKGSMHRKPDELSINSGSSIIINEPSNTNLNEVTRNLKRAIDDPVLSIGVTKKLPAFEKFRNESDDSSMPVILDVFTVHQEPNIYKKPKTSNIIRESNLPVTPPCSPPLSNLQIFSQPKNYCNENTTHFPSNNHSIMQSSKVPKPMSNVLIANTFPARNTLNNTNIVHLAPMKQLMYQTNFCVGDQTICHSISNGDTNQFSQAMAKNSTIPYDQKSASKDFVHERKNPLSRSGLRKEQYVSKTAETHDFCVYNDSEIHGAEGQRFLNNKMSRIIDGDRNEIGKSGLKGVKTINNVAFFSRGPEHNAEHIRNSNVSPNVAPIGKSLRTMTESTVGSGNGESNVFLSPRDIKVLELKRKLLEQEATLKRLRKHH